jgi:Ca2+-binding RTX toxin-like protein
LERDLLASADDLGQAGSMRRRIILGLILAVAVSCVPLAGTASAATVSLELPTTILYKAGTGETNALDVHMDGARVVFHDAGTPLTLGQHFAGDCTQPDQNTVSCDRQFVLSVRAELDDGADRGTLDLPLTASLQGGDGNDTLTVSTITPPPGPVEAHGDAGDDTLAVGAGQVLLYGGAGADALTAGPQGGSLLHGDTGEDHLTGGPGRDSLAGDDGADVIVGGDGDDQIFGDWFAVFGPSDHGPDRVDAGPGNDTVDGGGGDDIVMGGPGADALTGGLGNDQLQGAEDDDVLDGSSGNDTLSGDAGRDTIRGSDGADTATGGAGGDLVFGGVDDDRLTGGGPGATSADAGDRVDGEDGSDVVAGGPGRDALFGGAGDDRVLMGPRGDAVDAGDDDDEVIGTDGAASAIACGTGEDAVMPDRGDRVHIDCETIERSVRCPARWRALCTVSGTLSTARRPAKVLGHGATRVRRGRTRTLRVPLSPRGQAIVRRAKRIDVRLVVKYRAGTHRRSSAGTIFSLRSKLPSPTPH